MNVYTQNVFKNSKKYSLIMQRKFLHFKSCRGGLTEILKPKKLTRDAAGKIIRPTFRLLRCYGCESTRKNVTPHRELCAQHVNLGPPLRSACLRRAIREYSAMNKAASSPRRRTSM